MPRKICLEVRTLYPVTGAWAYFNHASVSPVSTRSVEVLRDWTADVATNACVYEARWKPRLEKCREQIAGLINATAGEIAFVPNTTEGISRVSNGYPWRPDDVVVVPADEYISNMLPWSNLEHKGVVVRRIPIAGHGVCLEDIRHAVCHNTRMVTLSAVHFATGWRVDLASIGAFCRERGTDLCVDAVQAVGVMPLDVEQMNISFLAAGGHKWLTGPQGTGFLFVAEGRLDMLTPSTPGWRSVTSCESDEPTFLHDARRFESGTTAIGELLALGEGTQIIKQLGISTIASRVYEVGEYLVEKLRSCGAEIVSRRERDVWSGIVAFRVPGHRQQDVRTRCLEEKIVLGLRKGHLRASVHFYNSEDDVDRLIAVIHQLKRPTDISASTAR